MVLLAIQRLLYFTVKHCPVRVRRSEVYQGSLFPLHDCGPRTGLYAVRGASEREVLATYDGVVGLQRHEGHTIGIVDFCVYWQVFELAY